ncbi:dicarboxylate/amino acid:cation symporter [Stenotrophomonas sp. W1S232]|uniref:Dicarboxylate/amino acid:cation symporter n=1 Tax=Stenotrophomonas koreensis TaxID=266128 RepID=A0A7W3YWJ2_9GAMM|nr:cation:dicarboxylase symporter family transporter [Stenotrophomonas koreensis]MBB1118054.1 dicarboxylate/amino acid:cation symporter [Stenotrophomonas koreensis]
MPAASTARRFRLSAPVKVLLGLIFGAVVGLSLSSWDQAFALQVAQWAKPVGRLWLNALQMTVVPLVTALVIMGVNNASNAASSGRAARNAIIVFGVLLVAAASFAAVATPALLSLIPNDQQTLETFRSALGGHVSNAVAATPTQWIATVIPSNALAAAASSAMLPLVVFALFFGFALSRQEAERRERLLGLISIIADTMITIIRWVLWAAPLGVFALVLVVCAEVGISVLGVFGWYILVMCTVYILVTLLLYLVASLVARENLRRFASALLPVQLIAGSTQSSLASLPSMIDSARNRLGYPAALTSLMLPMAVSLFRVTSPAQYIAVASFIAWLYGIDLGFSQYAVAVLLAAAISMGSTGLPGQANFLTNNLPVTQSLGLPVEPLGVLLAMDTIPDVFCTVGNVTGHMTATAVIARHEGGNGQSDNPA